MAAVFGKPPNTPHFGRSAADLSVCVPRRPQQRRARQRPVQPPRNRRERRGAPANAPSKKGVAHPSDLSFAVAATLLDSVSRPNSQTTTMAHAHRTGHRAQKAHRHWQIGQAHAQAGRWEAALQAHEAATQLAPDDFVYALNHARALMVRGDHVRACDEALRAYGLAPANAVACQLAAQCLMRLSRYDEAIQALRRLDPQEPRNATLHALLGSALQKARRMREAVAAYFDALAFDPSQAQLHYNLGLCFADLDLKREAAHCFHTTLLLGAGDLELSTRGLACYYERDACLWEHSEPNLRLLNAAVAALPDDAQLATTPFVHAVLGADRGGIPDAFGDAGMLVDPDDFEAVTGYLRRLATEPGFLKQEKQKSVARASRASWAAPSRRS